MSILSKKLAEQAAKNNQQPPHLIVEALAGTGKTTTLVEGLRPLVGQASTLTPSPQQKAVWDSIGLSKGVSTIGFCAFNNAIAAELKKRVPEGVVASTMHSLGNRAIFAAFGKLQVSEWRVYDIAARVIGRDIRDLRREKADMLRALDSLVAKCKANLVDLPADDLELRDQLLDDLTAHYDIELNGSRSEVYSLVPKVLEACLDVEADRRIDFNDMIWIPAVTGIPVPKFDLLLVDECQDLNRCQQTLAKKAGRRLVLCGDKHQAIYGFAGADAKSMERMEEELGETPQGCVVLPLTVTRRCGQAIVAEARRIVPEFEAHESNCAGKISRANYRINHELEGDPEAGDFQSIRDQVTYHSLVENGDMVICRVNAPLVQQCFAFLKQGRKAEIQGRDVGRGLVSLVTKLKAKDIPDLVGKLTDWHHMETEKELKKRLPSDTRLLGLDDKFACLMMFTEGCKEVSDVTNRIDSIFTDNASGPGIKLSSIHKAKGLEARRVFLIEPDNATVPHPSAKSEWQRGQEWNLRYVAITRAIEELVYVK